MSPSPPPQTSTSTTTTEATPTTFTSPLLLSPKLLSPTHIKASHTTPILQPIKAPPRTSTGRRSLVTRTHSPKTSFSHEEPLLSLLPKPPPASPIPNLTHKGAVVLAPNVPGMTRAARLLVEGSIVAFPTETVYGLGANALLPTAVTRIFEAKGRPLTDPLIVHVHSAEAALKCVEFSGGETSPSLAIFNRLAQCFWPGGLTLVAPAATGVGNSHIIPPLITAGTNWVGVRCPSHPLSLKLLALANVPIAAPSANKFGHVSPTSSLHVLNDLGKESIYVLDGEDKKEAFIVPTCQFGIESTVVKISDGGDKELIVLRQGAVPLGEIRKAADKEGWRVRIEQNHTKYDPHVKPASPVVSERPAKKRRQEKAAPSPQQHVAPGQLLTHYAPAGMKCYLVRAPSHVRKNSDLLNHAMQIQSLDECLSEPCVVIDYTGTLAERGFNETHPHVAGYKDLGGSLQQAARNLFETLRWAESVTGATKVLICDIATVDDSEDGGGVCDRIYRAASGKVVQIE